MFAGVVNSPAGPVQKVQNQLNWQDVWGAIKVRWFVNRDNYKIEPGLYAVGNPDHTSHVLSTANYKLSFDHLRKSLKGINAWIIVLDTKGVNVWCAAGKGTFGSRELVRQIEQTRLAEVVSHRKIIVPQLGATGISAHEVKRLTSNFGPKKSVEKCTPASDPRELIKGLKAEPGYTIKFGPVRAADIPAYIENNFVATPAMRTVQFNLSDRIKLIPVDLVYNRYRLLLAMLLAFLISGISAGGYDFNKSMHRGLFAASAIFAGYIAGIVLTPSLLPWLPSRMFAFKGLLVGWALTLIAFLIPGYSVGILHILSVLCIVGAISSFLAMNFTGASTFTSLAGVKKEMRIFVPVQIFLTLSAITLYLISNTVN